VEMYWRRLMPPISTAAPGAVEALPGEAGRMPSATLCMAERISARLSSILPPRSSGPDWKVIDSVSPCAVSGQRRPLSCEVRHDAESIPAADSGRGPIPAG
jgi:hypothetical protein